MSENGDRPEDMSRAEERPGDIVEVVGGGGRVKYGGHVDTASEVVAQTLVDKPRSYIGQYFARIIPVQVRAAAARGSRVPHGPSIAATA